MTKTITLPDDLASKLQAQATAEHTSLDDLIAGLLTMSIEAQDAEPVDLDAVVARIKSTPPDPTSFHPATASLAEWLAEPAKDATFDAEAWDSEWARVERELKAIDLADDVAEGRG